jgi:hypothetical protein
MLIRVIYANGAYDMVKEQVLDRLLERGEVAGFQRADGWAVVGRDRIRQRSRQSEMKYRGPERRGSEQRPAVVRY